MNEHEKCPDCGSSDLLRDEVDIGVGIQYGPYWCNDCGWSESRTTDGVFAYGDDE